MTATEWLVFRESSHRFSLRTLPDEKTYASGSLEACKAAGRLLSGSAVRLADEASRSAAAQRL